MISFQAHAISQFPNRSFASIWISWWCCLARFTRDEIKITCRHFMTRRVEVSKVDIDMVMILEYPSVFFMMAAQDWCTTGFLSLCCCCIFFYHKNGILLARGFVSFTCVFKKNSIIILYTEMTWEGVKIIFLNKCFNFKIWSHMILRL